MQIREKTLAPFAGPLDGPAALHGRESGNDRLALQEKLQAERATHVRRDEMHVLRIHVDGLRQPVAQHVHALAALVNGKCLAVEGDVAAARLHRGRRKPVVDDVDADDVLGVGEDTLGVVPVAVFPDAVAISADVCMDSLGLACQRLLDRHGCRQFVDFEPDRFGGVLGRGDRLRDDRDDRFADIAHPVARQRRLFQRCFRVAHRARWHVHPDHVLDPGRAQILCRVDGDNAGRTLRVVDVERADDAVWVRRAQQVQVGLVVQPDVVRVAARPGQEALVLLAAHRLSGAELTHE